MSSFTHFPVSPKGNVYLPSPVGEGRMGVIKIEYLKNNFFHIK
jgi:hypothetical protein